MADYVDTDPELLALKLYGKTSIRDTVEFEAQAPEVTHKEYIRGLKSLEFGTNTESAVFNSLWMEPAHISRVEEFSNNRKSKKSTK